MKTDANDCEFGEPRISECQGEYCGDIYALEHDADELLNLGVEIGPFRELLGCFENCHLSSQALRRLQVLGGKYLWDLEPTRCSVPAATLPTDVRYYH